MFQSVYESFRPCVKRPLVSKEKDNRALCVTTDRQLSHGQSRATLLIGWWKPSWCHCWIHSDMFIHQPRITPFQCRHCKALYWCIVQFLTLLNMTVTFIDYVNWKKQSFITLSPSLITASSIIGFCLCVCVWSRLCKHILERLPGHCFLTLAGFPLVAVCSLRQRRQAPALFLGRIKVSFEV